MKKSFAGLLIVSMVLSSFTGKNVNAKDVHGYEKDKETVELIITYKDNVSKNKKDQVLDKIDEIELEQESFFDSDIKVISVSKDEEKNVVKMLNKSACIESVQEDERIYIDDIDDHDVKVQCRAEKKKLDIKDDFYSYQWALKNIGQTISKEGVKGIDINAEKAWKLSTGSKSVLVGVLDSGVDIENVDLVDNIYVNQNEIEGNGIDDDNNGYVDDINGWDFYNDDNTVFDSMEEDSHGTYVSSIIGAPMDEVGMVGACPNVKIVPLKFISSSEGGDTSDAIRAIEYASKLGVKIINCSWAGSVNNKALKKAMKKSNILFICAAGNQGVNIDIEKKYPAAFKLENLISVGAIDCQGNIPEFSNYGKKNVDVLAPGDEILGQFPGNYYYISEGTSAACPYVTAEAALIYSIRPKVSAKKVAGYIKKAVVKDKRYQKRVSSGGRIDMYKAMKMAR